MSGIWRTFWNNYRRCEANTEADLFLQVGKTINKQPISEIAFKFAICRIIEQLELSPTDHLFEYCCGNGLVTHELAAHVARITAVDFVEHYIVTARKIKSRHNIDYQVGDAMAPLSLFLREDDFPTAFLMHVALAYFVPTDLNQMLKNITHYQQHHPFVFLMTDIPNFDLKWNFYNTPERRARHMENETRSENTNDGLGRWWRADEIEEVCSTLGLSVQICNQPVELSNYRMDALIKPA